MPDAEHDEGQMLWGPGYEAAVEDLLKGGDLKWQIKDAERQLVHSAGAELKASKGPHGQVSLRSISDLVYSVVREDTREKLEEITGVVALLTVHDGAAYMYHGQTFEVRPSTMRTAPCAPEVPLFCPPSLVVCPWQGPVWAPCLRPARAEGDWTLITPSPPIQYPPQYGKPTSGLALFFSDC